jgi:hypothetical protein
MGMVLMCRVITWISWSLLESYETQVRLLDWKQPETYHAGYACLVTRTMAAVGVFICLTNWSKIRTVILRQNLIYNNLGNVIVICFTTFIFMTSSIETFSLRSWESLIVSINYLTFAEHDVSVQRPLSGCYSEPWVHRLLRPNVT